MIFRTLDLETDDDLCPTFLRDLRGNSFRCDCKIKWLVDWMKKTNTSVPAIYCASPFEIQGRRIQDLTPRDFNCISAGKKGATLAFWDLLWDKCKLVQENT